MNTAPLIYMDYNTLLWRETQLISRELDKITTWIECTQWRVEKLVENAELPESDIRARLSASLKTAHAHAMRAYATIDGILVRLPCPNYAPVTTSDLDRLATTAIPYNK